MTTYLTKPQLRELTGTAQAARQLAWLDQNRWTYAIDAKGWPKVATAYHDIRMGIAEPAAAGAVTMPDWSSFGRLPSVAKQA